MYDPPTTLQQYVHRVGRTARAGADGHSYVLLSKVGASGNEEDGQVALFKSFDNMLLRKGKVSNLVKLRELNPEEVQVADELLMKTRARLQQQQPLDHHLDFHFYYFCASYYSFCCPVAVDLSATM